jgi:SAM-dependent methyltransferase
MISAAEAEPLEKTQGNVDDAVVAGFGDEWLRFDQSKLSMSELETMFQSYFGIFPWSDLPRNSAGFDLGCGSGRWARLVAARVGVLHCIDASQDALSVARATLKDARNCIFHHASVDAIPLPDESMDFGYSLGVLHHVPDTLGGLKSCTAKLRPGAPFLLYLYYAFDNRPAWFKLLWRVSDVVRRLVAFSPNPIRYALSQALAATIYWPLARNAALAERAGFNPDAIPLSAYRHWSFYVMRNGALDRFGTRLEQRFTRMQIEEMMGAAGLSDIRFSQSAPFWCAVGIKR